MTRILLPIFIGLFVVIGAWILVPIYLREMFKRRERVRELDEWLEDLWR